MIHRAAITHNMVHTLQVLIEAVFVTEGTKRVVFVGFPWEEVVQNMGSFLWCQFLIQGLRKGVFAEVDELNITRR